MDCAESKSSPPRSQQSAQDDLPGTLPAEKYAAAERERAKRAREEKKAQKHYKCSCWFSVLFLLAIFVTFSFVYGQTESRRSSSNNTDAGSTPSSSNNTGLGQSNRQAPISPILPSGFVSAAKRGEVSFVNSPRVITFLVDEQSCENSNALPLTLSECFGGNRIIADSSSTSRPPGCSGESHSTYRRWTWSSTRNCSSNYPCVCKRKPDNMAPAFVGHSVALTGITAERFNEDVSTRQAFNSTIVKSLQAAGIYEAVPSSLHACGIEEGAGFDPWFDDAWRCVAPTQGSIKSRLLTQKVTQRRLSPPTGTSKQAQCLVYYVIVRPPESHEIVKRLKGDAYHSALRVFLPAFQQRLGFFVEAAVPKSTWDAFTLTHSIQLSGIACRTFNTSEYLQTNFRRALEDFFHTSTPAGWSGEIVEAQAEDEITIINDAETPLPVCNISFKLVTSTFEHHVDAAELILNRSSGFWMKSSSSSLLAQIQNQSRFLIFPFANATVWVGYHINIGSRNTTDFKLEGALLALVITASVCLGLRLVLGSAVRCEERKKWRKWKEFPVHAALSGRELPFQNCCWTIAPCRVFWCNGYLCLSSRSYDKERPEVFADIPVEVWDKKKWDTRMEVVRKLLLDDPKLFTQIDSDGRSLSDAVVDRERLHYILQKPQDAEECMKAFDMLTETCPEKHKDEFESNMQNAFAKVLKAASDNHNRTTESSMDRFSISVLLKNEATRNALVYMLDRVDVHQSLELLEKLISSYDFFNIFFLHFERDAKPATDVVVDPAMLEQIVAITGTNESTARGALYASFNNPDRAVQFIYELQAARAGFAFSVLRIVMKHELSISKMFDHLRSYRTVAHFSDDLIRVTFSERLTVFINRLKNSQEYLENWTNLLLDNMDLQDLPAHSILCLLWDILIAQAHSLRTFNLILAILQRVGMALARRKNPQGKFLLNYLCAIPDKVKYNESWALPPPLNDTSDLAQRSLSNIKVGDSVVVVEDTKVLFSTGKAHYLVRGRFGTVARIPDTEHDLEVNFPPVEGVKVLFSNLSPVGPSGAILASSVGLSNEGPWATNRERLNACKLVYKSMLPEDTDVDGKNASLICETSENSLIRDWMRSLSLESDPATKESRWKDFPLHSAAANHFALKRPFSEVLADNLGSASQKDANGMLPLHCAAAKNAPVEIISMLLDAFPDGAKEKDKAGKLPLNYPCMEVHQGDYLPSNNLALCQCLYFATPQIARDFIDRNSNDLVSHAVNPDVRVWSMTLGTKYGRYKISSNRPVYTSKTCEVYFATRVDSSASKEESIDTRESGVQAATPGVVKADRRIALKFIRDRDHFETERKNRKLLDGFSSEHVLNHEDYHEFSIGKVHEKSGAPTWENVGTREYCVVMPAADRSLSAAIFTEYIAGKQVDTIKTIAKHIALGIKELHAAGVIHCDVKPRNVVRIGSCWKLIDFDAACKIGTPLVKIKKGSSGYCPPEMAPFLFRQQSVDFCASDRTVRSIAHSRESGGESKGNTSILGAGDTRDSDAGSSSLAARYTFDIWSFGVVLYRLCTASSLHGQLDPNADNILERSRIDDLIAWDKEDSTGFGRMEQSLEKLVFQNVEMPNNVREDAKDLIRWCLQGNPMLRPQSMDQILAHPFLLLDRNLGKRWKDVEMDMHDIFLSHKQEEAQYLVKSIKEYFARPQIGLPALHCFLDRDYRGELSNLVEIVGRSRTFLFILSTQVLESPWCMLELLSAVLHKVPIIFLRMQDHSMGDIGFPSKFEVMEFPEAAMLGSINAIPHSKTYFNACMNEQIIPRLISHRKMWNAVERAVPSKETMETVQREFEALRERRNSAFPDKRPWPRMFSF